MAIRLRHRTRRVRCDVDYFDLDEKARLYADERLYETRTSRARFPADGSRRPSAGTA